MYAPLSRVALRNALLPCAKHAYDKNRRNENRYDDGNQAKKKLGLRGQSEHQAVMNWAAVSKHPAFQASA